MHKIIGMKEIGEVVEKGVCMLDSTPAPDTGT